MKQENNDKIFLTETV